MAKSTIPDSFILIIGYIKVYLHLPYRQTEGIIKATIGKNLPDHPCYSQICKRTNKLDIDINSSIDDDYDDDVVIIIAAAEQYRYQGYKQRSRWMQDKWKAGKKGYLNTCSCKYKDQRNSCIKLQMKRYMMERL